MICITSYKRPDKLLSLLKELKGYDIHVFDDCSGYDYSEHVNYCTYHRSSQWRGKLFFWKQWNWMLDVCRRSDSNEFIFLQDDLKDVGIDTIYRTAGALEGKFAFNYMNIGEDRGWTPLGKREVTINGMEGYQVGYVDCCFATNRKTLEALDWKVEQIPISRFIIDNISSGCGQNISERMWRKDIAMYMVKNSLAYHRQGESVMHPEERKRNPLISR